MGPRDALHNLPDGFIVGGIGVASGLVDRGQGCFVEPDGGDRETSFLGQVGQVGGDEGRGSRQGQGAAGLGSGLKPAPGGVVYGPGVIGDAAV